MNWTATAAFVLALAVASGAFGAHALRGSLDEASMGIYEKAVFYHFVHALGLLAVPALTRAGLVAERPARWAAWCLLVGIAFFSGSLYALAMTHVALFGAVTPAGGTSFIAGWLILAYSAWLSKAQAKPPGGS